MIEAGQQPNVHVTAAATSSSSSSSSGSNRYLMRAGAANNAQDIAGFIRMLFFLILLHAAVRASAVVLRDLSHELPVRPNCYNCPGRVFIAN
jgi:hypothetical protein